MASNPLLDQFLSTKSEVVVAKPEPVDTLSDVQFQNLTEEVNRIREEITQGNPISLDQERLIVVWFRARRGKSLSLVKEKPVRAKAQAPARRAKVEKRPQLSALELLEDL